MALLTAARAVTLGALLTMALLTTALLTMDLLTMALLTTAGSQRERRERVAAALFSRVVARATHLDDGAQAHLLTN